MRFLLTLLIISFVTASAHGQNRRDRTRDRGSDRPADRSSGNPTSGSPVTDDNTDMTTFDRYKVLSDHNIFTKNRRPATRPTRDSRNDRPPVKPEAAFILTGCVFENENKYAAFV